MSDKKADELKSVQMLGLKLATDPRWVNIAEKGLDEILIDHAFCEQKAASSCISLIVRFSELEQLVEEVTPVVAEEWAHFRRVLKELHKRGYKLGPPRKDEYVLKLNAALNKGGSFEQRLCEHLLLCALIEARSCERFRLLSLYCSDEHLRNFYHEFMVSEAGHYTMFFNLALLYCNEQYVRQRWDALLQIEADIMASLEYRSDRVH